jgi:hypothetical protein
MESGGFQNFFPLSDLMVQVRSDNPEIFANIEVPEPPTLPLFATGILSLFGFGMMYRRRKAKA